MMEAQQAKVMMQNFNCSRHSRLSDDDDNEDDDDDKEDEDNEEPASTSGHQGPDDDDDDDADLPGTGPSSGGTSNEPPPPPLASQPNPLVSTGIDFGHTHDTRTAGGNQNQTTALMTYKKRSIAMVPSTGTKMAISIEMVSSIKGKEIAITNVHDSLSTKNPWIYKEFRLPKEVQLKEFLKADDMYGDMKRLAMLYGGVMQVAKSWRLVQYHDQTKCALPKHLAMIQILERVPEITVDNAVKDVNPWARQSRTDKISSVGLQVEMLLGHKPQYQCI
ncbi:hypothetical protein L7F22_055925 [Adiantum nelumboides]|nr:hypothetical protein [Adiantum nelumboides]